MPLGREVGLGPGDIVLDGDAAPPERGTAAPPFFAMTKTGGWIKMPRGRELGLSPVQIALDEDPALPERNSPVWPQ